MANKITDLFRKSKKDFISEKVGRQNEPEQENSLQNQLNNYKERATIAEKNLTIAKQLLRKSNDLNVQKDLKIQQLLNEINANKKVNSTSCLFDEYSSQFNPAELKTLRSTGPGIGNDSTFILNMMRFLYKSELTKLNDRSATGRKWKGVSKLEISFEKKEVMRKMLNDRVTEEVKNHVGGDGEMHARIKRLNDLIKSAIHNIVSNKRKRRHSESGADDNPNSREHISSYQVGSSFYYYLEYFDS